MTSLGGTVEPQDIARLQHDLDRALADRDAAAGADLCFVDLFALCVPGSDLAAALRTLSTQVNSVTEFGDRLSALQCARLVEEPEAVFLVDLAAFESSDHAVEELIALRRHNPGLATLILSEDFRRDDLSNERRVIADCSLRLPTTPHALATGIRVALENAHFGDRP